MCKYCEEEKWLFELKDGQVFKDLVPLERPDLQIMKQGDKYALNMNDYTNYNFMWNKIINYCPMCGEKL